jgi:MraZ protein
VAIEKFHGRYFHSLDDKGRVAIPHNFRTILGGANENRVILTRSPNAKFTYLDVYPFAEWDAITDRIERMEIPGDDSDDLREALFAHFVHPAQQVELDKQGRVLVPQEHREFAGIDKEVVFTGDGRRFRLWAHAEWTRYQESMTRLRPKLPAIPPVIR